MHKQTSMHAVKSAYVSLLPGFQVCCCVAALAFVFQFAPNQWCYQFYHASHSMLMQFGSQLLTGSEFSLLSDFVGSISGTLILVSPRRPWYILKQKCDCRHHRGATTSSTTCSAEAGANPEPSSRGGRHPEGMPNLL